MTTSHNPNQVNHLLYSESAQRASLGSALLDNGLMRGPLATLAVNDFVGSSNRTIFAEMLRLSEEGAAFDPVTLAQALESRGELHLVGGHAYLASLVDGAVPEPRLVTEHVKTIQKLSRLRRLQSLAESVGTRVSEIGADPDQLLRKLTSTAQSLLTGHDLDGYLLPSGPCDLSRRPEILTLSLVEPRTVNWLWEPYLPLGMLSMLSGDPGVGKTFVALAVAAAVTAGGTPFTNEPKMPADILYLSVENSPSHVLRPRFDLLGGDPSRFHILRCSVSGKGDRPVRGSIRLSDVGILSAALQQTKARLVIVDPIQSYLGAEVDAHRSNETRPVMDGLSRLAEESDCCILLVRHLAKAQVGRAIHRGLGSIDLTGAVRTELLAGCSSDYPLQRALVQIKSNLGQLGPSLGYEIESDGTFRWTGESRLTVSQMFAPDSNGDEAGALAEARDFLLGTLGQGPRLAKDVLAGAQQEGISARTLTRAKKELKAGSRKCGMTGAWQWSLPEEGQH